MVQHNIDFILHFKPNLKYENYFTLKLPTIFQFTMKLKYFTKKVLIEYQVNWHDEVSKVFQKVIEFKICSTGCLFIGVERENEGDSRKVFQVAYNESF